ncbi:hypothetical protein DDV96_12255 [Marixanthomonas spongiae]|uniref:Laminin IV type A domain-containing protein n=2 Tax=Marixanthomonas spongiae TaxID=2174845 RepID=A0A2U0HYH6_9FLAO|nr:hypothetical protein DDV96_12255 [Marixanthomonas spongiae]
MKRIKVRLHTIIIASLSLALLSACNKDDDSGPQAEDKPIADSMFKENAEGWRITGDAQGGYTEASYSPDGGVQDGYIYADDNVQGGVWYFTAPETYHGDKNEFYGAKLSFSLFQDSDMSNQFENSDIIFKNGDTQITYVYSPDAYPGEDWTDYSVTISAGNGWLIGEYDSEVEATEADIKAVLANVTEFSIRGEFESGPDNGGLDNIIIDK